MLLFAPVSQLCNLVVAFAAQSYGVVGVGVVGSGAPVELGHRSLCANAMRWGRSPRVSACCGSRTEHTAILIGSHVPLGHEAPRSGFQYISLSIHTVVVLAANQSRSMFLSVSNGLSLAMYMQGLPQVIVFFFMYLSVIVKWS